MPDVFSTDSPEVVLENLETRTAGTEVELVPVGAVEQIERAQWDRQVATAKAFPRSLTEVLQKAKAMACAREDVAAECTFTIPRAGKPISGPSVRLAEIMALAWGNLRAGAHIVNIGSRMIVARGFAVDLENNVGVTMEVHRPIVDKEGKRYSDDMIRVTAQAAMAIAFRNCIFKVIPGAFTAIVQREAQKVARKEASGLEQRRKDALEWFAENGVPREAVFAALGVAGEQDITWVHIDRLLGMATAIKTGEATIQELFPEVPENGKRSFRTGEIVSKAAQAPATEPQPGDAVEF